MNHPLQSMLRPVLLAALASAASLAFPILAHADPCEAALTKPGTTFLGPVRYVGDGDGLCIGASRDPSTWIEVRLADFYAPELSQPGGREAKSTLERMVMGRTLRCVADHRSYDRIVAACRLDGVSVGDLMRRRGVREGGTAYRRR